MHGYSAGMREGRWIGLVSDMRSVAAARGWRGGRLYAYAEHAMFGVGYRTIRLWWLSVHPSTIRRGVPDG
jgi:hypothetical protein